MPIIILGFFFGLLNSPVSALAQEKSTQTCPAGEHWVQAHFRNGYFKSNGTWVSPSNVNAHCHPNPPSYAIWLDKLKSGLPPGWLQKLEKSKEWTTEEKERILEALSELPPGLLPSSITGLYRLLTSGLFGENPASGQPGKIALYNPAFEKQNNLARILAHEFAHEIYRHLSDSEIRDYMTAADWLRVVNPNTGKTVLIPNRDHYSEEDGKESPDEDFSNNIEHFLFQPRGLQEGAPKVYNWIDKKFGDNFKLGRGSRK